MADLNIRNVSDEQMSRYRVEAATAKMTLREWVLMALDRISCWNQQVGVSPVLEVKFEENVEKRAESPKIFRKPDMSSADLTHKPMEHTSGCRCYICKPPKAKGE